MGCKTEALNISNQTLYKGDQDPALELNYKDAFKLD